MQHTFQTNGILLDDEWCAFFKEHNFLVGLSVDGPRDLHDTYRVDRRKRGTFDRVMAGLASNCAGTASSSTSCARSTPPTRNTGGECTASSATSWAPSGCSSSRSSSVPPRDAANRQPGLERAVRRQAPALYADRQSWSPSARWAPQQYGRFLVDVFEEWVRHDVGTVYVQLFDVTLEAFFGRHLLCIHAPTCGYGPGARVQRRSVFLRSFRRAAISARAIFTRRTC